MTYGTVFEKAPLDTVTDADPVVQAVTLPETSTVRTLELFEEKVTLLLAFNPWPRTSAGSIWSPQGNRMFLAACGATVNTVVVFVIEVLVLWLVVLVRVTDVVEVLLVDDVAVRGAGEQLALIMRFRISGKQFISG